MTNEQRKAIELAKEFTRIDFNNPMGWTGYYDTELKELQRAIDTALSLIKENQEKAENITTNYKNLIADVSMLAKELGLEEDAAIDEIYTAIRILKSKRINVIEQLDCIEKKDREIEKLEKQSKVIDRQAQKYFEQTIYLNKIIDLMADFMYKTGTGRKALSCVFRQNDECNENGCEYCIKRYFAGLVEKE